MNETCIFTLMFTAENTNDIPDVDINQELEKGIKKTVGRSCGLMYLGPNKTLSS